VAWLIFDDGLAEAAHHTFDHALNLQCQIQVLRVIKRESSDPPAKLLGYFPIFCVWVLFNPLHDAPVHTGAEGFHDVVSQRSAAFALDV